MDELVSRSSSSNYVSSLPSSSANEMSPDTTGEELASRNDITTTMVVALEPLVPSTPSSDDVSTNVEVVQALLPDKAEESSVKQQKSPILIVVSKLPRRLSLSLKKSGKDTDKVKEAERRKENIEESRKEKAKDAERATKPLGAPPQQIPVSRLRKRALVVRKDTPPSDAPTPPLLKRSLIPPLAQVKPLSSIRAISGASARPTISSTLKQTPSPPRRKHSRGDKENMRDYDVGESPTKPRMKGKKAEGIANKLGAIKVVRRAVV